MERNLLTVNRKPNPLRPLIAAVLGITAILLGPNWLPQSHAMDAGQVAVSREETADTALSETSEEDAFMEDLLNESSAIDVSSTPPGDTRQRIPLSYEGELMASLWAPIRYDDDWHTTNRLDLKGWKEAGAVSLGGRFRLDYQDLEEEARVRADLRELHATYQLRSTSGGYADITIGKKILYWGKGDEIRPVDRVCPEDLTALYFNDLNDRKTGRIGTFIDVQFNRKIRFEGFWSPYFQASETPEPGDYFESTQLRNLVEAGIPIDEADEPDEWSPDAGIGGRIMFSVRKTDMAFYAFQGYTPQPAYVVNRLGPDPYYGLPIVPRSVCATYPRITLYGADIERSLGTIVLRAEAAYQTEGTRFALDWQQDPTLLLETPDGTVEKGQLQYLVGMDKQDLFAHNLFLNLQFLGSHILDYDPQMVSSESETGMTAYLRYTCLDSKLELWYRYMALFNDKDQRHHVEIGYKPLPWAQVSLGAVAFGGDRDTSYFGQYADRDYIYTKLKMIF